MYERIDALVKERGMNMSALSRETGIAENVFSNLKSRKGNLSIDNALKIARYFGVSIEDLIGDET